MRAAGIRARDEIPGDRLSGNELLREVCNLFR